MPLVKENSLLYEVIKVGTVSGVPIATSGTSTVVSGSITIDNTSGNPIPTTVTTRTPTTTSVSGSTNSTTILAANSNRRGLSIANDSVGSLRLSYSTPATSGNAFIVMQPGSFLWLDQQLMIANAIYGIWTVASGTAQVTEYV
jgi:hypothetical protein